MHCRTIDAYWQGLGRSSSIFAAYRPGLRGEGEINVDSPCRAQPSALSQSGHGSPCGPPAPGPSPLEAGPIGRGITLAMASHLVRDHGEEEIRAQIEHLDWLVETKPGKVADPAAWLVAAIRNGHAAPKGFTSKAERQRREETRQAREREKIEGCRRQREQEARDRATREEVDAHLKRLTPAERKALEAAALARAGPEARQGYEEAPARLRAAMLLGLLREHVGRDVITAEG